jgi:hypothetical protein
MLQTFCHLGYILLKENISELNLLPEKKNFTLKQVLKNFTSLSPGRSSQDIVDAEASAESDLVTQIHEKIHEKRQQMKFDHTT